MGKTMQWCIRFKHFPPPPPPTTTYSVGPMSSLSDHTHTHPWFLQLQVLFRHMLFILMKTLMQNNVVLAQFGANSIIMRLARL